MISEALTLVRMDLMKLRRRRGLMAIGLLLAVGAVSVIFAARAVRHGGQSHGRGPAGGIKAFEGATDFVGLIGVVVAAMIGSRPPRAPSESSPLRSRAAWPKAVRRRSSARPTVQAQPRREHDADHARPDRHEPRRIAVRGPGGAGLAGWDCVTPSR